MTDVMSGRNEMKKSDTVNCSSKHEFAQFNKRMRIILFREERDIFDAGVINSTYYQPSSGSCVQAGVGNWLFWGQL